MAGGTKRRASTCLTRVEEVVEAVLVAERAHGRQIVANPAHGARSAATGDTNVSVVAGLNGGKFISGGAVKSLVVPDLASERERFHDRLTPLRLARGNHP